MREGNEPVRAVEARTEPPDVAEALTDGELVALARAGVAGAFREIMRRNNRRLFRAARGVLRDDPEAEDVVQETYVRAFQALAGFRGEASLSTWLTRIAYNEALGRVRRRRTTVDLSHVDHTAQEGGGARIFIFPTSNHANGSDPEGAAARRELRELLEGAVDALPGRFRVVLLARDVDGMSVEETAGMLGVRPETVRTRLHRARRLLRAALEERVGDALRGTFPFDGARCHRLTEAVMARLGATATPGYWPPRPSTTLAPRDGQPRTGPRQGPGDSPSGPEHSFVPEQAGEQELNPVSVPLVVTLSGLDVEKARTVPTSST